MEGYEAVTGWEKVVDAFGIWPSFHDAEIHSVVFQRPNSLDKPEFAPFAEIVIHAWNMVGEVTDNGTFKQERHHLVTFHLEAIDEISLEGCNFYQNVIFGLTIDKQDDSLLQLTMEDCYGLSGTIKARAISIKQVLPFSPSA